MGKGHQVQKPCKTYLTDVVVVRGYSNLHPKIGDAMLVR